MSHYHKFLPSEPLTGESTGYVLHKRKSKADITGISLRTKNTINYTPLMQSDPEDENDECAWKQIKLRPQPSGPSSMVLRANATINNDRTKNFQTKLIIARPIRRHTSKDTADETETNQNKINTKTEPVETEQLDGLDTENVETETETMEKIPGTFVTKTVGIQKQQKARRAKCRICDKSSASVKELNRHHHNDHDIQFCNDCDKGFNTQTVLDKHKYLHKELKFVCETCGRGFPFDSRLEQHKITHRTIATLPCMRKGCRRIFKNLGNLNRHVGQHDGVWYTCDFCTYCNKDKHNTNSHMRTHVEGNELFQMSTLW